MILIDDNLSLIRANPDISAFESGDIDENTSLAYSNLFYPYLLDNGGSTRNVALTIDVMNRAELELETKDLVNKQWVSKNRLENSLVLSKAIWGFKEAFHSKKKSKALSNAIVFGGQELTIYIAPQGHSTGYTNNEWIYCKTVLTISVIDVVRGTDAVLYEFEDFQLNKDDSKRFFNWTVPVLSQETYNNYGVFGLSVLKLDIEQIYFEDAEFKKLLNKNLPYKNQSNLQLLIYSGAKESIEVDAGDADILTSIPSYEDTLEQIFAKTILQDLESLNQNALTDAQKRAIIADQIAVLFMSQHPILTADYYPGKIVGWGASQASPPRKVVNNVITYGKRYPNIIPLLQDRLFGMLATYKSFNFRADVASIISDVNQSSQIIRDPVRTIYIDSNGEILDELGIDGIVFHPYIFETSNVEQITDVTQPVPIDLSLFDGMIDIQNITITNEYDQEILPYTNNAKIGFDVVYGTDNITQIRYSIFTQNSLNYQFYVDSEGITRSHTFILDGLIVSDPSKNGDIITAQIDIEDITGGITSFIANKTVDGYSRAPFLLDLKIYQRNDGSRIVDVYYTYDGLGEINNSYLYVQFSVDNGITWSTVPISSLKGDYGNNVSVGRRRVSWLPAVDIANWTINNPVLCRLTLYDVDSNIAYGNSLTGALVMNIGKTETSIMSSPIKSSENRISIGINEIVTVSDIYGANHLSYSGGVGTSATVMLNEVSFVIGNVGQYFVWDIDGESEHTFTYEGESIEILVNEIYYSIIYDGVGSLMFTILFVSDRSSSSSSSSTFIRSSSSTEVKSSSSSSSSSSTEIRSSSSTEVKSSSSTEVKSSSSSSSTFIRPSSSSSTVLKTSSSSSTENMTQILMSGLTQYTECNVTYSKYLGYYLADSYVGFQPYFDYSSGWRLYYGVGTYITQLSGSSVIGSYQYDGIVTKVL